MTYVLMTYCQTASIYVDGRATSILRDWKGNRLGVVSRQLASRSSVSSHGGVLTWQSVRAVEHAWTTDKRGIPRWKTKERYLSDDRTLVTG